MDYLNIIFSETYKIFFLLVPVLVSVAMIVWLDRRIWAFVQKRQGPNVVGPFGLLQSLADALKYIFKEVIIPSSSNKVIFILAPIVTMTLALISWAVIPFSATQVLADINVGILYLFAVSSLGVYGIIMGGWASNSKYPFLGAIRSAAQMVSYEVSIGIIIVNVLLCVGSLNLNKIVLAQENILLVYGRDPKNKLKSLLDLKVNTLCLPLDKKKIHLHKLMEYLAETEINNLWVEAGPNLNGSLLELGLIDELITYIAPILLGGNANSMFNNPVLKLVKNKIQLKLHDVRSVGPDLRIQSRVIR